MKRSILAVAILALNFNAFAQKYEFTTIKDIETSEVKNQGRTGTCWSFSTSSFIESEIFRLTGKFIDVSEMYSVRSTYPKKAQNYVMRQGKAQFSEGGLAHDVINAIKTDGLIPETAFSGLLGNATKHDHSKIVPELKNVLDSYIKNNINSPYPNWRYATDTILNKHLGKKPANFYYNGKNYTPQSFLAMTKFNPNDYVTITSFSHKPYYSSFILNIPDNFSYGNFYNLPLDEFVSTIKNALKKGYSIELDCDVSEKSFSAKHGVAFIPNNKENTEKGKTEIIEELEVIPNFRQAEFNNFNTTDDHLMHITGLVKDQKGNLYYKVKNSWGGNSKRIGNNGYIYMSEAYLKLKTISVLLHKDALGKKTKRKLNL